MTKRIKRVHRIRGPEQLRALTSPLRIIERGSGAGLFVWLTRGPATITHNYFYDNESQGEDGGGTWLWSEDGTITLDGNVFSGNVAFRHGGGANLTPDAGSWTSTTASSN